MGMGECNMLNFYSRWSDEQLRDVIIPLMGKMSLPTLDVQTLREFNMVDSEAIFMHASLPQDRLVKAFNNAVELFYSGKWSIDRIFAIWTDLPDYTGESQKKTKTQEYVQNKFSHYPEYNETKPTPSMSIDKHYAEHVQLPVEPPYDISKHYGEHAHPTRNAQTPAHIHYVELDHENIM